MKPRHLLRFLLIGGIVALCIVLWNKRQIPSEELARPLPEAPKTPQERPTAARTGDEKITLPPLKKGARTFYGALPSNVPDINALPMANSPSPQWKQKLEKQLIKLGGANLKSVKIRPEESYVIPDGTAGRYVERVVVQITSKKGEYTSFFAEVDSETGYVLKSWGAAIPEKTHHR